MYKTTCKNCGKIEIANRLINCPYCGEILLHCWYKGLEKDMNESYRRGYKKGYTNGVEGKPNKMWIDD